MMPKMIGSKEVAHLLDCSPDDALVMARRMEIRAQKIGARRWGFDRDDVLRIRRKMSVSGRKRPS